MKNISTLTELKKFIQTAEAFDGEPFNYKGFHIWWNHECETVQTPMDGYFRCDPGTNKEYKEFDKLCDKLVGGFEWYLS